MKMYKNILKILFALLILFSLVLFAHWTRDAFNQISDHQRTEKALQKMDAYDWEYMV